MEPIKIKIQNYRSVPLNNPVELEIKEGITFILGMNNVGKSNILKILFELRGIFHACIGKAQTFGHHANFFFDEVVNRKWQTQPIIIEVASGAGKAIISLRSHHGHPLHTQSLICEVNVQALSPNAQHDVNEALTILTDTMYVGAFRGADHQIQGSIGDVLIGQNFNAQWSAWSGGDDVSNREKIEQLETELKELLEFKRFSIRLNDAKSTLLITTDNGQFKLNELGGGVSQLIMLLANAAIRNPSYILIDEPEIGLHPRMQEILVRTLASKAKCGLIASSHSVGLARSVAEQLYSLTKLPNGGIHLGPFGEHYTPTIAQSINELGYSQFVEIGGDNILLVEGRTDVKAFREILRKYGIETSFIILPFGGREFIIDDEAKIVDELAEVKRLNPKSISVIFDSDFTRADQVLQGRRETFRKAVAGLGYNVFPTDRGGTENYVSQMALDSVLGAGQFKAAAPYEKFNDRQGGKWDKNKNWLLFREMSRADFTGTGLDTFISDILVPLAS